MISEVKQTEEELYKMYKAMPKSAIIGMLIESNKHLNKFLNDKNKYIEPGITTTNNFGGMPIDWSGNSY